MSWAQSSIISPAFLYLFFSSSPANPVQRVEPRHFIVQYLFTYLFTYFIHSFIRLLTYLFIYLFIYKVRKHRVSGISTYAYYHIASPPPEYSQESPCNNILYTYSNSRHAASPRSNIYPRSEKNIGVRSVTGWSRASSSRATIIVARSPSIDRAEGRGD